MTIRLKDRPSAPDTPPSGEVVFYALSSGVYLKRSDGTVIGPLYDISQTASGDLSGTWPSVSIRSGVVSTAKLADGAVTPVKTNIPLNGDLVGNTNAPDNVSVRRIRGRAVGDLASIQTRQTLRWDGAAFLPSWVSEISPFVVGHSPEDPYSEDSDPGRAIQEAILAANTAWNSNGRPQTVVIKPGQYAPVGGIVELLPGVSLWGVPTSTAGSFPFSGFSVDNGSEASLTNRPGVQIHGQLQVTSDAFVSVDNLSSAGVENICFLVDDPLVGGTAISVSLSNSVVSSTDLYTGLTFRNCVFATLVDPQEAEQVLVVCTGFRLYLSFEGCVFYAREATRTAGREFGSALTLEANKSSGAALGAIHAQISNCYLTVQTEPGTSGTKHSIRARAAGSDSVVKVSCRDSTIEGPILLDGASASSSWRVDTLFESCRLHVSDDASRSIFYPEPAGGRHSVWLSRTRVETRNSSAPVFFKGVGFLEIDGVTTPNISGTLNFGLYPEVICTPTTIEDRVSYARPSKMVRKVLASGVASWTVPVSAEVYEVDATAGAQTLSLPSSRRWLGGELMILKVDSSANAVTVAAAGGESESTILYPTGAFPLSSQYNWVRFLALTSGWTVVGSG